MNNYDIVTGLGSYYGMNFHGKYGCLIRFDETHKEWLVEWNRNEFAPEFHEYFQGNGHEFWVHKDRLKQVPTYNCAVTGKRIWGNDIVEIEGKHYDKSYVEGLL